MTTLKNLSFSCELDALRETMVKDVMIAGLNINYAYIREKLLLEDPKSLEDACKIAKSMERSKEECKELTRGEDTDINLLRQNQFRNGRNEKFIKECHYCGGNHKIRQCPAYGATCKSCNKPNHFAKVCKAKGKINVIKENEYNCDKDSSFYFNSISISEEINMIENSWNILIKIRGRNIYFQIDTGAQANVISMNTLKKLGLTAKNITKTNVRLSTLNGNTLPIIGIILLTCKYKSVDYELNFFVIETDCRSILHLNI